MGYVKQTHTVDWAQFIVNIVKLGRNLHKSFYIKNALAKKAPLGFKFQENERDASAHHLK